MENISILVAFSAGLLSFLTPCVLPLVPVYLASLCGPEIFYAEANRKSATIFLHSLSFVIGFTIVFSLWGAGAGLIGSTLISHLDLVRKISGGLLIVFGLFMLAALKIPWLNYEKRLSPPQSMATGYVRSLLTGAVFTFAWTPCLAGPVMGILALAGGSGTAWQGTYLLTVYSLGLGLPFLVVGAVFNSVKPLLQQIHRYSSVVYIVAAVLLIAMGIVILTVNPIWLQSQIFGRSWFGN